MYRALIVLLAFASACSSQPTTDAGMDPLHAAQRAVRATLESQGSKARAVRALAPLDASPASVRLHTYASALIALEGIDPSQAGLLLLVELGRESQDDLAQLIAAMDELTDQKDAVRAAGHELETANAAFVAAVASLLAAERGADGGTPTEVTSLVVTADVMDDGRDAGARFMHTHAAGFVAAGGRVTASAQCTGQPALQLELTGAAPGAGPVMTELRATDFVQLTLRVAGVAAGTRLQCTTMLHGTARLTSGLVTLSTPDAGGDGLDELERAFEANVAKLGATSPWAIPLRHAWARVSRPLLTLRAARAAGPMTREELAALRGLDVRAQALSAELESTLVNADSTLRALAGQLTQSALLVHQQIEPLP